MEPTSYYSPGTLIGQYEIAGRPLVGGMGIVYLCLDHQENRPVALETFRPEYLPDRAAPPATVSCAATSRSPPGRPD